jgi:hypothetical protein
MVVDPIRHGAALGSAGKIVTIHNVGLSTPMDAWVLEVADQHGVFGIGADNRRPGAQEAPSQFPDPAQLAVAIGMRRPSEPLDVCLERELELAEHAADSDMANGLQLPGQPSQTYAHELALPFGISPSVGLDQAGQLFEQRGTFFRHAAARCRVAARGW